MKTKCDVPQEIGATDNFDVITRVHFVTSNVFRNDVFLRNIIKRERKRKKKVNGSVLTFCDVPTKKFYYVKIQVQNEPEL